ncbi:MAG TPA: methyltransferase domain-containing protein [Opitutaceae bacterium]|nr:methyltransferase domain-containing protein [Opitutaceae bacterium]
MSLRILLSNFARTSREKGYRAAVRAVRERIVERHFESHFDIETRGVITPLELGFATADSHSYVATSYTDIFRMLRRLAPTPADVLLDYGCGKGRALVVAATFPFSQAIGVELSEPLVEEARRNLQLAARRFRCPRVEVWQGSAADYRVPDEVTIAYFNNPFSGGVLAQVLDRLRASLARRPRALRLACTLPPDSAFERTLEATPDIVAHDSAKHTDSDTHQRIFQLCA